MVNCFVMEIILRKRLGVLSWTPPQVCLSCSPDNFVVNVVQHHMAQAAALVEDVQRFVAWISWYRNVNHTLTLIFNKQLDAIHIWDYGEEFCFDLADTTTDNHVKTHVLSVC